MNKVNKQKQNKNIVYLIKISVRMTEKADYYMDELLQQQNIRTSSQGLQLNRKTSASNAPLNTQQAYTTTEQTYAYQPANTAPSFILGTPQPNPTTNLNTSGAGFSQTQRAVSPNLTSQTQISTGTPVVVTQPQFNNTAPVLNTQYISGPPLQARTLPTQFNNTVPFTTIQNQSNTNLISGGSFATQPQRVTTTTQQIGAPVQVSQVNTGTAVPITTTTPIQSNINIPVTNTITTQGPVLTSGAVAANQAFVGSLPRTVTQITQSRLNGELPAYQGVITQSQATPVVLPVQPNQQSQQQPVGSFSATSKIEYVPFNRKIIEYEQKQSVQKVPKTKRVTEYREETVYDLVPRQAVKQDYYAVQYIKQYVAEYIPEKRVNMVRRAVPFKRIQYVPVTRQVYHGAPLGEEGSQHIPFCCDGTLDKLNQIGHGTLPWQAKGAISGTSLYQAHNYFGGYPGGYLSAGCCDQYKRKLNNLYDNYQAYIPTFKY